MAFCMQKSLFSILCSKCQRKKKQSEASHEYLQSQYIKKENSFSSVAFTSGNLSSGVHGDGEKWAYDLNIKHVFCNWSLEQS
jgi:hypothetical protein